MSITPFLPGLASPVPGDTGGPGGGEPGDPAVVFGEALAAALLATVPPSAAPLPGVPATPASAPLPAADGTPVVPGVVPGVGTAPAPAPTPATTPTTSAPTTSAPTTSAPSVTAEPATLPTLATAAGQSRTPPSPTPRDPTPAWPEVRTAPTDPAAATVPVDPTTDATPALGSAGPTPATALAGPRPTVERAVVQQVFPEVTRLVTSTPADRPGTHRITLTLQPEHLGEVRVTLVVKDGAVQVRLAGAADDAAGSAAVHRALSSGAPELQRLLERSGASEARVLVRDPLTAASAAPPAPTAPGASTASTASTGTGPSGSGALAADAGGDGASARDRSAGDPDRRGSRQPHSGVPEPAAVAATAAPARPTTPAGQLDRTL